MSFLRKIFKNSEQHMKQDNTGLEHIDHQEYTNIENSNLENTNMENSNKEYEIVEKEILPEKMICPDCGGITLVGLDFCDKCGGELAGYDNY